MTDMTMKERFDAFDDAAAAEGKRAAPIDFNASRKRLMALIDMLPQRALIKDEHAERWVDRTLQISVERMEIEQGEEATLGDVHAHVLWHIRRASAVGGSEIGTIVKHFRGEPGNFTNARNLVMDKLLIMTPMPGTPEMSRGVRAEPVIQEMYLKDRQVISDEASLDKLKGFRWEKAPYMVGTPDDMTLPRDMDAKKRRIVDYKCPSADVNEDYEKNGISFDYKCQVHHYAILCRSSGVSFSGMEIACFDPRYFVMTSYEVPMDVELAREMITAAKTFWDDFVMQAHLPEVPGPAKLDVEDPRMKKLTMELAVMKVVEDEIKKRKGELQDRLKGIGEEANDLSEGKVDLGYASFNRKRTWDEDTLRDLAEAAGLDLDDYMTDSTKLKEPEAKKMFKDLFACHKKSPEDVGDLVSEMAELGMPFDVKLDVGALVAALEEKGVDLLPAMGVSEGFRLSTKKKGPEADMVTKLKNEASELADTIEEIISNTAPEILAPEQPEDMEMMIN
jgi:predicted phage-related endonuclease